MPENESDHDTEFFGSFKDAAVVSIHNHITVLSQPPPISPLALDCNNYICVARNSQQHMPTAVRAPPCCPTTTGSEAHLLWGSAAC